MPLVGLDHEIYFCRVAEVLRRSLAFGLDTDRVCSVPELWEKPCFSECVPQAWQCLERAFGRVLDQRSLAAHACVSLRHMQRQRRFPPSTQQRRLCAIALDSETHVDMVGCPAPVATLGPDRHEVSLRHGSRPEALSRCVPVVMERARRELFCFRPW